MRVCENAFQKLRLDEKPAGVWRFGGISISALMLRLGGWIWNKQADPHWAEMGPEGWAWAMCSMEEHKPSFG